MNLLLQIVAFLALGYFGIVGCMYWYQESFLFYPTAAIHEDTSLDHVQTYSLTRNGVTVRGWLVNPQYARHKLVIYYGGNGEDVYLNVDEFEALQCATLFVAYRGYGPSEGEPGEEEIFGDALGVFDDMKTRYPSSDIFLMGRSLGSGVACYVASKRKVIGSILITPYDSLVAVAQSVYPWLPVSKLLRHRFESVNYVADVQSPFLVFYGGEDRVVPPARTEKLLKYINSLTKVVHIERADHGTIGMFPEYWPAVIEFLDRSSIEPEG
ncbi:MAG: pimeloyl-ACP methyl ester carboxylesterase [Desulforhopalus sp.]|jgi:pimeloyl-ACP methyl ester carboxylesterase